MSRPAGLAGAPTSQVPLPPGVVDVVGGASLHCVWQNGLGGLAFAVGSGDRFLKWMPPEHAHLLTAEGPRLRWAGRHTPVPAVLDAGSLDGAAWLLTARVPGTTAVAERWQAAPDTAVRAIGEGLRALHDALPVADCPFDWSAASRVAEAERRAHDGRTDPTEWRARHPDLPLDRALALLAEVPPPDRTVVCHGDACAPNTLIGDDGRWCAHVDLGALGVGDRWADLAVATWSTEWNYGAGFEGELLAAYGVRPDPERTRFYRLLWDLT